MIVQAELDTRHYITQAKQLLQFRDAHVSKVTVVFVGTRFKDAAHHAHHHLRATTRYHRVWALECLEHKLVANYHTKPIGKSRTENNSRAESAAQVFEAIDRVVAPLDVLMDVGHAFGGFSIDTVNDNAVVYLLGAHAHFVNNEGRRSEHARITVANFFHEAVIRSNHFSIVRHHFEVSIFTDHLRRDFFFKAIYRSKRHHQRKHADRNAEHTENANQRDKETLTLSP